jgi:hypothetical protein
MAATLRFDDGSLELEVAADTGDAQDVLAGSDAGGDMLSTLPEDTAVAVGVGLADGWFGQVFDQMAGSLGAGDADALLAELSRASGLDLPDDVETLTGKSAAIAVGSDFDLETMVNSSDGSGLPVGLKVQGDPEAIQSVLDKVRPRLGAAQGFLGSDADSDVVAIGPDADYRARLLEDGGLGETDVFRNVVREADDAGAIIFVNFDAADGWLSSATGDDAEVAKNLEPLEGLGVSGWVDGGTSHLVLRITTD